MNEGERPIILGMEHRAEYETGSLKDLLSYVNSYNAGEHESEDQKMNMLMKILKLKLKLQKENVDLSGVPSILGKS